MKITISKQEILNEVERRMLSKVCIIVLNYILVH